MHTSGNPMTLTYQKLDAPGKGVSTIANKKQIKGFRSPVLAKTANKVKHI